MDDLIPEHILYNMPLTLFSLGFENYMNDREGGVLGIFIAKVWVPYGSEWVQNQFTRKI